MYELIYLKSNIEKIPNVNIHPKYLFIRSFIRNIRKQCIPINTFSSCDKLNL